MNGYPGFIDRLRKATLNVDIDTAKLLVEAANVIEDISSNWEPKRGTVETVEDLADLPVGSVILSRGRTLTLDGDTGIDSWWDVHGNDYEPDLPAQILWAPEGET